MEEDVTEPAVADSPESSVEVQQEPDGDAYTIKVDGEERQVSLEELRDGFVGLTVGGPQTGGVFLEMFLTHCQSSLGALDSSYRCHHFLTSWRRGITF